jgi:hypothetical protein
VRAAAPPPEPPTPAPEESEPPDEPSPPNEPVAVAEPPSAKLDLPTDEPEPVQGDAATDGGVVENVETPPDVGGGTPEADDGGSEDVEAIGDEPSEGDDTAAEVVEGDETAGEEPSEPPTTPSQPDSRVRARQLTSQANAANRSGKVSQAISLYKRALAARRNYPAAAYGLSGIYFNKADYQNAAKYGAIAARGASRNSGYQLRLGDIYYKMGKKNDATQYWKKAAALGNATAKKRLEK